MSLFDFPSIFYHGSDRIFDRFNPRLGTPNEYSRRVFDGVFLAPDRNTATKFATSARNNRNGEIYIYTCDVGNRDNYILKFGEKYSPTLKQRLLLIKSGCDLDLENISQCSNKLVKNGIYGVFTIYRDQKYLYVFDPNIISIVKVDKVENVDRSLR